jgi:hypothetical protein
MNKLKIVDVIIGGWLAIGGSSPRVISMPKKINFLSGCLIADLRTSAYF